MSSIHHQDIATPWAPQPIAWREGKNPKEARDDLRHLAEIGETHVVREVRTRSADFSPPHSEDSIPRIEGLIASAQREFRLLEACGLYAPPQTEWHTFRDPDGHLRTLARVAIIDGEDLNYLQLDALAELSESERAAYFDRLRSIETYADLPDEGARLPDAKRLFNYRLGSPRDPSIETPEGLGPWSYLLDVEPDFWAGET